MKSVTMKILTECLNIKPLEKVTIVTDTRKLRIAKIFFDVCRKINLETVLVVMEPRKRDGEEPSAGVERIMKFSDVIIAITSKSLTHTRAVRHALTNARIASMPGIEGFSFTHGLSADWKKVSENVEKMFSKVDNSNFIEVKAKNGTSVYFSVRGRQWHKDDGKIHEVGEIGNLPAGEVFIAPVEDSVNGRIVFDYFPLSRGKLILEVENGLVKEVKGEKRKLEKIFKQVGRKARQIAEFGIGCNSSAKLDGLLESEKVFGTVHFGLGSNISFGGKNDVSFHLDGVIKSPTVVVDNRTIIKNGKWKIKI